MYRKLLEKLTKKNKWVNLQPPCPESEIEEAEKVVGHPFPKELKELLREVNGDDGWCLMSAREIMAVAVSNREFWAPFFEENHYPGSTDGFIFFAQNGCGDYYCYQLEGDGVPDETAIYMWKHEEIGEGRCWHKVASNMAEFIKRYYKGKIREQ